MAFGILPLAFARGLADGWLRGKQMGAKLDNRTARLEEAIAHLEKRSEELSDVVARQAREIDLLTRRVAILMQREAEREAETASTVPLADQKPPHW